jgi:hypothetical protein
VTQTAFPVVGADLTDAQWSQTVGAVGNGILDDWGNPYSVTVNTNDTITIRTSTRSGIANALVAGFGHRMDAPETLAVSSAAGTYHTGLLYDPANAALPVRLAVLKGTTVPLTAGQQFLPFVTFVRTAGQTLTLASSYTMRPKVTPTITVVYEASLLATNPQLFLNGTVAYCADTDATYRAGGTLAVPKWVNVSDPGAILRTSLSQSTSSTSNEWSTLNWNVEESDRGNAHDSATPQLLVTPKRGLVTVSWGVKFGTQEERVVRTRLLRNNSTIPGATFDDRRGASLAEPAYNCAVQLFVEKGDNLRVQVASEAVRVPVRITECRFSFGYLSIG